MGFLEVHGDEYHNMFPGLFGADCEYDIIAELNQPWIVRVCGRFSRFITRSPNELGILKRVARMRRCGLNEVDAFERAVYKWGNKYRLWRYNQGVEGD
jgi:hypothetical protein